MITFFLAVIAWDTLWLQILVVQFFRKAETLHKDYVTDGVLDSALSFVETKKLIPTLANIFVRARDAQSGRRRTIGSEELQEMLQEIDYIPDFKLAQTAMDESNELKALFDCLQYSARSVWKLGLVHIVIVFCIPLSHWIPQWCEVVGMKLSIILAVGTFCVAIKTFVGFQKQMDQFLDLLKKNREIG